MTLQDFIDETHRLKNKTEYEIVLQVDGFDDDAFFIEIDKSNKVIRIFGE